MSGNKQTILRSNKRLTLLLFFSTSQYHHYPTTRHDDLEQYGTTTCSTLCSQWSMFRGASSFNQDVSTWDTSLYYSPPFAMNTVTVSIITL